jgi:hypothetical protein
MHFQFRGKGLLVPVFAFVPAICLSLLTVYIQDTFFVNKFHNYVYSIVLGISFILSGLWNNYANEDFYFDDEGEKHFIDCQNQFMWIEMKIFSYFFWGLGALGVVGGIGELILP